ncbi:BRCA2, helical [Musa troglodytarum]|uniref:BRCA2, helical n=1 Tax=Musa troglodytarum TaxID=320322 RepID=A0A9E7EPC9_9LILI|nr:BRCA2, helical [Musa troglodytarum]
MQESVGQLKSTLAEPVESKGKYVENFQQNQGNIDQDADMCFSLDFPNGHLKTTGPVDSFRPKANSQNDDKELGVEESFCASTLCSGCNQTQATHSEINAAQQLIQAEQSILLNTSGDKEWVQSGDIDVLPNTAESKEQASCLSMSEMHQQSFPAWTLFMTYLILVEPLAIVEDANLATPSSGSNILSSELNATQQPLLIAKEFAALKSTDDRLQVSFSDGDLRAFLDNQRSDVRQVGKFQPRNKSQPKK